MIILKMEENLEKYNTQLLIKQNNILLLKESYNEQRSRIEIEHEMLSDCLFDMSMKFSSLRNEMLGKFA